MSRLKKIKIALFFSPLFAITLTIAFFVFNPADQQIQTNNSMNVIFKGVEDQRIKDSFLKVMKEYESLHDYQITLTQSRIKASTMQAQPIINLKSIFTGIKKYEIKLGVYVRDSETITVADLPEDVLTGWFAHELGHLVDYEAFSNIKMVLYGLKYLISEKFKIKVEHAADYIAIENGFRDEIIATKNFILNHETLEEAYKEQIRKYYLSVDDVIMCSKKEPLMKPKVGT
ncbi:hypothetical protein GCM10011506_46630 [Marivirga lumbricoides]|uniref:Peptidase M48 domain-containing protein n=2 Tax=Marivirga lumbricoides TaxID=1046115 RepID=A0ABQ1NAX1_9BACT|nr:hypothetical protein GCM10011506_46630 [Marivirga lumbricoides]